MVFHSWPKQCACTIPHLLNRHDSLELQMPDSDKKSLSYRDAGVDIDAGNQFVEKIKPYVARTQRPEVLGGIGGFGAGYGFSISRNK